MLLSKWTGAGVALLVALMPLFSQAAQADRTYRFSLLHTNDEHGHFWFTEQGEYGSMTTAARPRPRQTGLFRISQNG